MYLEIRTKSQLKLNTYDRIVLRQNMSHGYGIAYQRWHCTLQDSAEVFYIPILFL